MMTNDYARCNKLSREIKAFLMSRKVVATHALPTVNVNVIGIEPCCVKEKSTNRFWRNIARPQRPCCSEDNYNYILFSIGFIAAYNIAKL